MSRKELEAKFMEFPKLMVAEYDVANQISHDIEYFQKNKNEYQQIYCSEVREIEDIPNEEFFWKDYDSSIYFESFEIDLENEFTKHIGKEVYVEGRNIGWRNRSGEKTFTLNETMDMFREIAPECDLTYSMEKVNDKEYEVRIAHHDSPMGELYNLKIK